MSSVKNINCLRLLPSSQLKSKVLATRANGLFHFYSQPISHHTSVSLHSESTNSVADNGRKSAAALLSGLKTKQHNSFDLNPPKGTRDFYPEDHRLKAWIFGVWRDVARRFAFEEYDAPVVENEELYIRKAGEEVTQQLYNFEDKGGRRLSLRPEMTPSLARMVMAKRAALHFPLKWCAIPQCWRYERMTRGRRREHYQWNMDIWGIDGVEAEAELLAAAVTSLEVMGLTSKDVGIKINSRKILTSVLSHLGVAEENFAAACVLIDKLEKNSVESLISQFSDIGISASMVSNIVTCMKYRDVGEFASMLGSANEGVKDITRLFEIGKGYNINDWLVFDPSVVRGLSYYTGIVFEGFDRNGELRAIFGGGRYDKLIESFGGESLPAVGFGFGDAVIVELLKSKGRLPDVSSPSVEVVVYAMEEFLSGKAACATTLLRKEGLAVDYVIEKRKPKSVFQRANKMRADVVVLFAAEEASKGQVVLKRMTDGVQVSVDESDIISKVKSMIASDVL